jgi:hypothetical protein
MKDAPAAFRIFGTFGKTTFSTISALFGHRMMSDLSRLCAPKRTPPPTTEFRVYAPNPSGRAHFDFARKTKIVVADQADLPCPVMRAKIFGFSEVANQSI